LGSIACHWRRGTNHPIEVLSFRQLVLIMKELNYQLLDLLVEEQGY